MSRYTHKWTLKRSRLGFTFRVLVHWFTRSNNPLYANGNHYIDSTSGGGKTLLMNIIIRNSTQRGGFYWANKDEFNNNKRVLIFDIKKLFSKGEQNFRLDPVVEIGGKNNYCKGAIWDEINHQFNRRNNKNKDYNEIFIPLIDQTVTHRHARIPRNYFIGQSIDMQDTQLTQIIKWRHFVKAKYKYYYYYWRNELKLVYAPKKLIVDHYKKMGIDENGNSIFKKISRSKIKVKPIHLETYNTFAFESNYLALPSYNELSKK